LPKHELLFLVFSYLVGGIPFGFALYYLLEGKDIRKKGSGNIGASNVLRTKGRFAGIATLVLDLAKGVLPILYGMKHFDSPVIIIGGGAAAIVGHLFSVYLKFRGGKGIAAFFGAMLVFYYPAGLVFGTVFAVTLYLTKYVSASSIAAITAAFFVIMFTQVVEVSMIVLAVAVLVLVKHKENFRRISTGAEHIFSWTHNCCEE
jgi:acyl phosphate:glycerol-3-phosphate acyltransferase